jgi:hypothetical protein
VADGNFISGTLTPDVQQSLTNYFRRKEAKINKALREKLIESADYLKEKIAEYAPQQTGQLRQTILSLPVSGITTDGTGFSFTKTGIMKLSLNLVRRKDKQIRWVNNGTGIYGPTGQPIRPKSGEYLYFEVGGQLIRTRQVAGQEGQHFIERALSVSKLIISTKIRSALR